MQYVVTGKLFKTRRKLLKRDDLMKRKTEPKVNEVS